MKKILAALLAALMMLIIFTYTAQATDNGADDAVEAADAAAAEAAEVTEVAEAAEAAEPAEAIEAAEDMTDTTVVAPPVADPEPEPKPGEPLTWAYLATIAGATAATLFIVQYLKVPLDKVWKIPTRAFVYLVALVLLMGGTYFTSGLTVDTALLTAVNAVIVAIAAYGAYEVTFKKLDINKV
jgi:hypothetical protein